MWLICLVLMLSGFSFSVYSAATTFSQNVCCGRKHAWWLCNGSGRVIGVVKADGFREGNVHKSGSPFPLLMIKWDLVIPPATFLPSSFFPQLSRKGWPGFLISVPLYQKDPGHSAPVLNPSGAQMGHGGTRLQMEQKDACACHGSPMNSS